VRYIASIIPSAPLIDAKWYATVFKERTYPAVGRIAMFKYGEKVTESHVAVVKEIRDDGFLVEEANWKPCKKTTRLISWDDPALVGFLDLGTPRKVFALR
jgi:surface antigen